VGGTHLQDRGGASTAQREIFEGNTCASRTVGKPKDRWIHSVKKDARNLLGTAGWEMALDRKIWGRKI